MLTLQQQIELKEKISNNQISVSLAKELYWKDLKAESRSWQSADWKERRENFLGDKCEVCNSEESLTIQHRSHPRNYKYFENEVTKKYLNDKEVSNLIIPKDDLLNYIIKNYEYFPIPLCPNCKSRKPNKRLKKEPIFLCTKCHLEFNETSSLSLEKLVNFFYEKEDAIEVKDKCFISKDEWGNKNNLNQILYWFDRNKTKSKNSQKIEKEAFLLYLDDNIKYLSFEDAITACKRCASNYDLKNLELCPICMKFYKGIHYSTCIECLPEDKRKSALKKVEFGRIFNDMHKNLGID